MTSILCAVMLAQTPVEPEVFVDRSETYVRIGFSQGLTRGVTVDVVSADKKVHLGTAVVMEVWDGLARLNLDSGSSAFKGLKLVRLRGAGPAPAVTAPPPPPSSAAAPAAAPKVAGPPPPLPSGTATQRVLTARVTLSGGVNDARRMGVENLDGFDWHGCDVVLADGRSYSLRKSARAVGRRHHDVSLRSPGLPARPAGPGDDSV